MLFTVPLRAKREFVENLVGIVRANPYRLGSGRLHAALTQGIALMIRRTILTPVARLTAVFFISMALVACGGGASAPDSPGVVTPPPPAPPPPVAATASFTAVANANVNTPVVFDASASSSSDGSALLYSWDFGNGQHGGGKTIARLFADAGAKSVTLTVIDATGHSATQTKTIAVSSPGSAPATVTAQGVVKMLDGTALQGVSVTPVGSGINVTTDAMGKASLAVNVGVPITLKLSKAGYADQFVSVQVPTSVGSDAYFEATMRSRDAALTLSDAAVGGSLAGRDGATILLPANALISGSGAAVTGPIQIAMTPVDVTQLGGGGFPGQFDGVKADGTITSIVSFGTTEYVLSAAGQPLQLAPGKTAIIEVPLYASKKIDGTVLVVGDTTPLWSLDEGTGIWVQEGEGTVVASTASPSGFAMRATVSHFSWWNSDIGFDPYGPQPKCVYDTDSGVPGGNDTFATATICNLLAEIDRGPDGSPTGADGRAHIAAVTLSPRVAGYSRRAVLPVSGGITIPVPANINVALNAAALNGSWTGRTVVNGPMGVQAQALIKMRPLQSTGSAPEVVTAPFDATRSLQTNRTATFNFAGSALKYARITVTRANGSTLIGGVRLLQGATVLGTTTFGGLETPLIVALPADATYSVQITGTANTPGAYRVQIELLGGLQSDTLTLPFDVTKAVPTYTTYRGTFNIAIPTTVHFVFRRQASATAFVRVVAPNGTAIFNTLAAANEAETNTLSLPTAGNYVLEVSPVNAQAASFHFTMEPTSWAQVAPPLVMDDTRFNNVIVDLVADRNGKAVVGYSRIFTNGSHRSAAFVLRRWTGSTWENVASDLIVDFPCNTDIIGTKSASLVFDGANNPVLAYGSATSTSTDGGFTVVQKYVAGAWQPIGPNGGALPNTSMFRGSCNTPPAIQMDTGDLPVVAYRADNNVNVQRYDGTVWKDVVAGGATFSSINGTYDLRIDASGRVWFVLAEGFPSGVPTVVRRLNPTPTPVWETIGANGGALPQTNTAGLSTPRLRFDTLGSPVIGATAAIGSSVVITGTIVYRYNGSVWSSTGGFQTTGTNPRASGDQYMGFALFNGDAVMGWLNSTDELSFAAVVQRNTALGWTAIGAGIGEIPQFTVRGLTESQGWQMRLSPIDGELYMAIVVRPMGFSGATPSLIYLMRKVAN